MTDPIDLAGESPGPDRAPGQGVRHRSTPTILLLLLVAGCVAAGVLLLLFLIYIGQSRPEPA